jgi:hypothetical protein
MLINIKVSTKCLFHGLNIFNWQHVESSNFVSHVCRISARRYTRLTNLDEASGMSVPKVGSFFIHNNKPTVGMWEV